MRQGFRGQQLEGFVVVDVAVLDHSTVAVVGVFAHADIGDDGEFGHLFLDGADRALNDAMVAVGVLADRILGFGNAEQDHCGDAELMDFLRFGNDVLNRLLVDSRH